MFLEQLVIQNEHGGMIYPNSVNIIRVMIKVINKTEVFFSIERIGSGESIVDNFHKGGMGVQVDIENGILVGNGITKELKQVDKHPIFNEFKIPYWKDVKDMVCETALINNKISVVVLDVAIGKDGPVIIEANRRPGFDLVQVVLKKGCKYMINDIIKSKE